MENLIDLHGDGGSRVQVATEFCFYRPTETLESVTVDGVGDFLRFGDIDGDSGIYVHKESGEVYSWFDSRERQFINSSIEAFNRVIRELSSRYPFYEENSDLEDWESAARMVRNVVADIDPLAADEEGFWSYFSSDVGTGDFFE